MQTNQPYAYLRVSSNDQNINRQLDSLTGLNIPDTNCYIDKQSGKDFERFAWLGLIDRLQPGDLLYVQSIDRLGRNYHDIHHWWKILTQDKQVDIVVLDMPLLDTRRDKDLLGTFLADVVLSVFSYVAQNERENIRKRQAEGIASAKARGINFGRPAKPLPPNFETAVNRWEQGQISFEQALEQTGGSASTFYRRLRVLRQRD